MDTLVLVQPTEEHFDALSRFRQEFLHEGQGVDGSANLGGAEDLYAWLAAVRDNSSKETVSAGLVPSTTLLALREKDGRLVGMVDIRHELNEGLLQVGGHIGYCVRKSERRKGYAKQILGQALACLWALGAQRALLTCDDDNTASEKVILACGGVLESCLAAGEKTVKRYWIAR